MNISKLVLPGLALGAAGILIVPGEESYGFSKIGGSLGTAQRDFRVFDNFADAAANNNTTPHPTWPGQTGAEMAIWKGFAEWGSSSFGDGEGDPTGQGNIGDGGANFDTLWSGIASGIGQTDDNIVSAINNCGGGTLAFTETPISNGWRIRFCDNWTWADGPGGISGATFDIQSTACHEFGHALGLGHSSNGQATMAPSISGGQIGPRSIHSDDIDGLTCIYGAAASTKPVICSTTISGTTLTIDGVNFTPTNDVWFTSAAVTATGADPRVRVFQVPSTGNGTQLTLTIPSGAGAGQVSVKAIGGTTGAFLSNGWPFDPATSGFSTGAATCGPFNVALISPSTINALNPGTAQTVTATGSNLNTVESIDLNTETIPSSRWTIVNENTITIDMPQAQFLGPQTLFFNHPGGTQGMTINIVANATPALQIGTGDPLNVVTQSGGVDVIVGGEGGEVHWVYYSTSDVPSNATKLCMLMGNNYTEFWFLKRYTVGFNGYTQTNEPYAYNGSPVVLYLQSIDFGSGASPKFGVSNLQSVTVTQ